MSKTSSSQSTFISSMSDRDGRVRAQSIRSLSTFLTIHQNDENDITSAHDVIVHALSDDDFRVRSEAMRLMVQITNKHPQQSSITSKLMLIEDAFVRLCTMVRDYDVNVRSAACAYLGKLQDPSDLLSTDLLLATFDKISLDYVPPHLQKKHSQQGTQPKVAQSEPTFDENDSRIYADAIGTFVLGLEDEHRAVRLSCLQSIATLSNKNHEFAHRSVDFLIEMFNDEIDEVRIASIQCLSELAKNLILKMNQNQLQISLVLLNDRNVDIRMAVYELLSRVVLSGGCNHSLQIAFDKLSNRHSTTSLHREANCILNCIAQLGRNHPRESELILYDLLQTKCHLMTPEQDLDLNSKYVCALVLLYSASALNPNIFALMPHHIRSKHLNEMKNRFPNLIKTDCINVGHFYATLQSLPISDPPSKSPSDLDLEESSKRLKRGFEKVRLLAKCGELKFAKSTLALLRKEMSRSTPLIRFCRLYSQMCMAYLTMLLSEHHTVQSTKIHITVVRLCNKIIVLYDDGPDGELVRQMMVVKSMVALHLRLTSGENSSADAALDEMMASRIKKGCAVLKDIDWSLQCVNDLFPCFLVPRDDVLNRMTGFLITSPQSNTPDRAVAFPSCIPLILKVECEIPKCDLKCKLLVRFPDASHVLFPLLNDGQDGDGIIQTEIRLEMEAWTESAPLEFEIVCEYKEEDVEFVGDYQDDALNRKFVVVTKKPVQLHVNPHR
ncbi:hypothetical protein AKO1_009629 [Acrasis kona]|uniref:Integrator complex subunit 4/Protein SIEL C-terminal Ig-like domain-containing protein n=1 Tax=Acrasis kona TaxID=1008807 RepID=A0AAW2ZLR2_9EUKA